MPYIKPSYRDKIDPILDELIKVINTIEDNESPNAATKVAQFFAHSGVLNYCCTRLIMELIPIRKYWAIAMKTGVLKNVADEYYRRFAVEYQEECMYQNGDIYE